MRTDDLLEDDALRLVDVLLEEELLEARLVAAPRPRRRAGPRWLAAALVVLGIGVVVGVVASQPRGGAVRTGQDRDSRPLSPVEAVDRLGDARGRAQWIASVRRIGLERIGSLDLATRATGEVVGRSEIADAAAVREIAALFARALDGAEFDRDAAATAGADEPFDEAQGDSRIVFADADGRSLGLWATLHGTGAAPLLHAPGLRVRLAGDGPLAGRLREFEGAVGEQVGVLRTASIQPYREPAGPRPQDLFATEAARGVALLPTVQRLEVPADALDDDAMRVFATMPALRSLTLTGSVERITAAGLAAFGSKLRELRIVQGRLAAPPPHDQLRAIAALPGVEELWIDLAADDAESAQALAAMPALRRLAVAGHDAASATVLLAAIARTRVEHLMLQAMAVDANALRALADLPTLRDVDLRFVALDAGVAAAAIAGWRQVRRLDLRGSGLTADAGADLRHALPDCTVLLAGDRWVNAAFAAPTWAREPRGD